MPAGENGSEISTISNHGKFRPSTSQPNYSTLHSRDEESNAGRKSKQRKTVLWTGRSIADKTAGTNVTVWKSVCYIHPVCRWINIGCRCYTPRASRPARFHCDRDECSHRAALLFLYPYATCSKLFSESLKRINVAKVTFLRVQNTLNPIMLLSNCLLCHSTVSILLKIVLMFLRICSDVKHWNNSRY